MVNILGWASSLMSTYKMYLIGTLVIVLSTWLTLKYVVPLHKAESKIAEQSVTISKLNLEIQRCKKEIKLSRLSATLHSSGEINACEEKLIDADTKVLNQASVLDVNQSLVITY